MSKRKMYHLSSCSTCQRIIKGLSNSEKLTFQDIKTEPITLDQLKEMHQLAGSYEAVFSKRAMKYRSLGLNEQELSESDMKDWILKEYTFLKRPVTIIDDQIFIGSAKSNVSDLQKALNSL